MGDTLSWAYDEQREANLERFNKKYENEIKFTRDNIKLYTDLVTKCYYDIKIGNLTLIELDIIKQEVKRLRYIGVYVDGNNDDYFITQDNIDTIQSIINKVI